MLSFESEVMIDEITIEVGGRDKKIHHMQRIHVNRSGKMLSISILLEI